MKSLKSMNLAISILTLNFLMFFDVNAHIMVAQRGTVNIVDESAYVVLSLPIAAFEGIDSNEDGQISMIEFNVNRKLVTQAIEQKINLRGNNESSKLMDVLLSPVQNHHSTSDYFTQLTVMGKFDLKNFSDSITLIVNVFGKSEKEKSLEVTTIQGKDKLRKKYLLTSESPSVELLLIPKK